MHLLKMNIKYTLHVYARLIFTYYHVFYAMNVVSGLELRLKEENESCLPQVIILHLKGQS